jgi:adenine-specific DNA-methyltransferase
MKKLKMHTPDLTQDHIARIGELFPNCVTEAQDTNGKLKLAVDFDQLKQELSASIVEGPQERYHLNWPGKREALLTANAPIAKTLRPCREESVDFDTTQNLFIEGDNLEALKLLQETYLGKVKMIYIDPPYNTGSDLIYEDDFTESITDFLIKSEQSDDENNRLVANLETNGRFHSDWLSMIYPRLKIARNLLSDNGVIFLSIGHQEIAGLKLISDNIFGTNNYVGCISRLMKSGGAKGTFFTPNIDYILVYAKDKALTRPFRMAIGQDQIDGYYNKIENDGLRCGERYGEERLYLPSLDIRPNQRFWIECPDGSFVIPPGKNLPKKLAEGEKINPTSEDKVWRWTYDTYAAAKKRAELFSRKPQLLGLLIKTVHNRNTIYILSSGLKINRKKARFHQISLESLKIDRVRRS